MLSCRWEGGRIGVREGRVWRGRRGAAPHLAGDAAEAGGAGAVGVRPHHEAHLVVGRREVVLRLRHVDVVRVERPVHDRARAVDDERAVAVDPRAGARPLGHLVGAPLVPVVAAGRVERAEAVQRPLAVAGSVEVAHLQRLLQAALLQHVQVLRVDVGAPLRGEGGEVLPLAGGPPPDVCREVRRLVLPRERAECALRRAVAVHLARPLAEERAAPQHHREARAGEERRRGDEDHQPAVRGSGGHRRGLQKLRSQHGTKVAERKNLQPSSRLRCRCPSHLAFLSPRQLSGANRRRQCSPAAATASPTASGTGACRRGS